MKCLTNLDRTQIPHDIVMSYINIYKSIGINHYNHETLSSDYPVMVRQTVSTDTHFFTKIFALNVSNSRLKSLIYKDVLPKNKDERYVLNLKKAFSKIHNENSTFELLTNEIFDVFKFLYKDILPDSKLQFRKIDRKSNKISLLAGNYTSTRESLEELIKLFNVKVKEQKYEVSFIIENFYIDFINMNPFVEKNKELGLILLYILLLTNSYEVFEYISFMEIIAKNKTAFELEVRNASFNWTEGFSQLLPLHRFFLKVSSYAYDQINELIRNYEFDSQLNKSNNIENTINKLPDVFSKDEIRNVHPYISDSTINRTLKRLRDDEIIRPLGKGRSAKWIKLIKSSNKKISFEQLDLKLR
ncbi:MAG: hypothetical protein KAH16_00765 [Candidatus Izimaplasma sp.]|nr:hypothetical protein [Candidatus Izimaplasma bacterium]